MSKFQNFLFFILLAQANGGEDFDENTKYMVSIRTRTPKEFFGDNHFCGGTLVSKRHVLTAANCIFSGKMVSGKTRDYLVVAGSPYRLKAVENITQQIGVEKIYAYEYFPLHNNYHIVLLKLKRAVRINKHVDVIDMDTGIVPYGADCLMLGWGRLWKNGPVPSKAISVATNLLEMQRCKNVSANFDENVICTGDLTNMKKRVCDGDVGGPLICDGKLTGVSTWSTPCYRSEIPNIFESVSFHEEWITKNINGSSALNAPIVLITLAIVSKLNFF